MFRTTVFVILGISILAQLRRIEEAVLMGRPNPLD